MNNSFIFLQVVNVAERSHAQFANNHMNRHSGNYEAAVANGHHDDGNVAEVYINNEYNEENEVQAAMGDDSGDEEPKSYEYSAAGERMLISISGDY